MRQVFGEQKSLNTLQKREKSEVILFAFGFLEIIVHLAAMAYNLKKYLKFTQKRARSEAKVLGVISLERTLYIKFFWSCVSPPKKQNSTLVF